MCDSAWYGMLGCGMNIAMFAFDMTVGNGMWCCSIYCVQLMMRSVKPISFGKRATKQDSVKFDNSFGLFSHLSHVFFQLLLGYLSAAISYASKSGQLKAKTLFDLGLLHGTGWSEGGSTSRFFALTSITGWVTCRILSDYTHPTVSNLRQFRLCWEYKLGFTGYHLPHLLT